MDNGPSGYQPPPDVVWPPPPTGGPPPSTQPFLDVNAFKPLRSMRTVIIALAIPTLILELTSALMRGQFSSIRAHILFGLISSVFSIVGEVFVIAWLYRACRNIQAMSFEPTRLRPALAAASIIIPFVNLVLGIVVYNELWRRSEPWPVSLAPRTPIAIPIWWTLLTISYFSSWVTRFGPSRTTMLVFLTIYVICRTVSRIMTMIMTDVLTKRLHDRHDGLIRSMNAATPPQPWR